MPATRSRTENWRRSLQSLADRNGALEVTLPRYFGQGDDGVAYEHTTKDLIWRVRIMELNDDRIVVEEPSMLGKAIQLDQGRELVGIICIGQNRWMFRTTILESGTIQINGRRAMQGVVLQMPDHVERCQRRNFYRVSTVGLNLPQVEVFPLLDPATAVFAETRSRMAAMAEADGNAVIGRIGAEGIIDERQDEGDLPHVGPMLRAVLMNVGGGGVGLLVEPEERSGFENERLFWMRINLKPHLSIPLCVTARMRHTHIDSAQRLYAGMAFDFGLNPEHERFVVDQICRYVARVQREQLSRNPEG
ncbi:MAG: hypothetical protein AAFX05_14810 [Planctomycetota bacterium]